jgi:hypothetical protein
MSLYKIALQRTRIALDTNHDGMAEKVLFGGSMRLARE